MTDALLAMHAYVAAHAGPPLAPLPERREPSAAEVARLAEQARREADLRAELEIFFPASPAADAMAELRAALEAEIERQEVAYG